ncbi:cell division-specific peptidoglycan biosynthesis regulator FtsW [Actinomycetospora succinea]|uniref:Probable peptidoglycan glycosyltransferase FtsW n=1 Tax=Actinomycetospora succinea TaxID=663603 RepID=A0A4R6V5P1_9PSEU|nr:putative lipid II flippase FtsW [Actinomycetospora succinea]TDQ55684.1 cell division-specific peptidoglycan biosynthesis regulator FtsW [Actinomycetospora succinea]
MSAPARGPGRQGRAGRGPSRPGVLAAARTTLHQWLERPLTSLHLVLAVFGLLTALGLVMVLSASAVSSYAAGGSSYGVFFRQAVFALIGLALFWLGLRVPPRKLRAASPWLLAGCLVLLVLVLVPGLGAVVNGSRSWFRVAGLSLQPSELTKIALALWGAHVLVRHRPHPRTWRAALMPLLPVSLAVLGLVLAQPDLGTTISLMIIVFALLWFACAPLGLMAFIVSSGVVASVVLGIVATYRQSRITAFLNPEAADPLGPAYQARQALYSLADGGLFGAGLGQGRAKWDYLPNADNDFIFAIIGEELGFVGAAAVIALFATLAYVGLRIAVRSADPWIRVVASTLTVWLVAQACINIGYVVGLLPVTGIPLPLVSSGGTSLALALLSGGLLANFARHEPEAARVLRAHGQGRLARALRLPEPEVASRPTPRTGPRGGGR